MTDIFQPLEEPPDPEVDVVLLHPLLHGAETSLLLLGGHCQCRVERSGDLLYAVRIDRDGLQQLPRRTGKFAEYEHPLAVSASGHIFLGDKVHPVAQRCDESDVGATIETDQLAEAQRTVDVPDRHPVERAVLAVDLTDHFVDFPLERRVAVHPLTRGNHHEHEDQFLAPVGKPAEELADGREAFRNSLCVVEARDAENHLARAQAPPDVGHRKLQIGLLCGLVVLGKVDSHREHVGLEETIAHHDLAHHIFLSEESPNGAQECLDIVMGVESDEVQRQQPFQNLAVLGKQTEDVEMGKRDVQEEAEVRVRQALPEAPRHQHEVVIVNPEDVAGSVDLKHFVAELFVGLLVGLPFGGRMPGVRREGVEDWPDGAVGVPLVVPFDQFLGEKHRHTVVLGAKLLLDFRNV